MESKKKEIIEALSSGPVQKFILDHERHDVRDLVLKHKVLLGVPTAQLFEQITTRKKAKEKLPLYYHTAGIIFPPPANFEQSSSQATAEFKRAMIRNILPGDSETGADLTGGFGVDTYFLSHCFNKMYYVEPEMALLEIARHSHRLLGAANIEYHPVAAEAFLALIREPIELIYADPSRRTQQGRKIHALASSQPDILKLKDQILQQARYFLLKASPLLDLQAGIAQLGSVNKVWVLSVQNEVKEILFLCEKDFRDITSVEAVNLSQGKAETFQFSFEQERKAEIQMSDPMTYLYEPNASIMKAGAFKSVAARYNLKKIQTNTHLYTGEDLVTSFPGRKFLIEEFIKPDRRVIKKYFPDGMANVMTRNYPLSAEALKKKIGLKDGGEKFLIGFSGKARKFLAIASRLI